MVARYPNKIPTLGIIISLIAAIYSQWHQNPKYDSTIAIILSVIPLAYFTFIFLGGPDVFSKTYKKRSLTLAEGTYHPEKVTL